MQGTRGGVLEEWSFGVMQAKSKSSSESGKVIFKTLMQGKNILYNG